MAYTHQLIAQQTASSATASLTFSSIPQTYTDLLLFGSTRTTTVNGGRDTCVITLNGNTTANNYGYVYNIGYEGGTATGNGGNNYPNARMGYMTASCADAQSTYFGVARVYFPSYTQTGYRRTIRMDAGIVADSTGQFMLSRAAGRFVPTDAITSITVYPNSDNWDTGTTWTLYGIKNS